MAKETAITKSVERFDKLRNLLEQNKSKFGDVLPKHLTPERLTKLALSAISREPKLLDATTTSILRSIMQAAELGLEVGTALGSAYLVPFRNKHSGVMEAQMIPGYRGLIDLARRSGQIEMIEAHPVYEKEIASFGYDHGSRRAPRHRPWLMGEPGGIVCVYAFARIRGSSAVQKDIMRKDEVDAVRRRSKASESGPWVTDYNEMARKTVVKRLCKYLPLSSELSRAIEIDSEIDSDDDRPSRAESSDNVIDMPDSAPSGPGPSASQQKLADATSTLIKDGIEDVSCEACGVVGSHKDGCPNGPDPVTTEPSAKPEEPPKKPARGLGKKLPAQPSLMDHEHVDEEEI